MCEVVMSVVEISERLRVIEQVNKQYARTTVAAAWCALMSALQALQMTQVNGNGETETGPFSLPAQVYNYSS
jgi:uncharacterized protein (DUF2141 family)